MSEIKKASGGRYLIFGVALFVIVVLIDSLTQLLLGVVFGGTFFDWEYWVQVLSRIIPAVLWIGLFMAARKLSIRKLNFNLTQCTEKISVKNYFIATFFVAITIVLNYLSWGNFKLIIEYQNAGLIGFIAQHIYYFAEVIIVATLIVLFQKACETWFKKSNIPYGGIIAAVTWGLIHILTQNSITVGLLAALYGVGFGSMYLILKRNFLLTVLFLFLMFIL